MKFIVLVLLAACITAPAAFAGFSDGGDSPAVVNPPASVIPEPSGEDCLQLPDPCDIQEIPLLGPDACELGPDAIECGGSQPCTAQGWIAPNQWDVVLCGWNNWRHLWVSTAYVPGCAIQFYYWNPTNPGPSVGVCQDVSNYYRPGYGYYDQIRVNNYTNSWIYVAVTATT